MDSGGPLGQGLGHGGFSQPFQTFQMTVRLSAVLVDSSQAAPGCGFPCSLILRILMEIINHLEF